MISNPPYNMRWKHPPLVAWVPQFIGWPLPPESNANYAFILSGLMADTAVILLPCSVLAGGSKEEQAIRQQLVGKNYVDAVVLLPDKMFESTSIPTCIMVLKRKRESRMVEMVDMRETYEEETRDQRGQYGGASHEGRTYHKRVKTLSDEQIQRCVDAVQERKSEEGFCLSVRYEDIKAHGYTLSPSAYIEKKFDPAPRGVVHQEGGRDGALPCGGVRSGKGRLHALHKKRGDQDRGEHEGGDPALGAGLLARLDGAGKGMEQRGKQVTGGATGRASAGADGGED